MSVTELLIYVAVSSFSAPSISRTLLPGLTWLGFLLLFPVSPAKLWTGPMLYGLSMNATLRRTLLEILRQCSTILIRAAQPVSSWSSSTRGLVRSWITRWTSAPWRLEVAGTNQSCLRCSGIGLMWTLVRSWPAEMTVWCWRNLLSPSGSTSSSTEQARVSLVLFTLKRSSFMFWTQPSMLSLSVFPGEKPMTPQFLGQRGRF